MFIQQRLKILRNANKKKILFDYVNPPCWHPARLYIIHYYHAVATGLENTCVDPGV